MANKITTAVIALFYFLIGACAFVPKFNGGPVPNIPSEEHIKLHFENEFWNLPMNYVLAVVLVVFGLTGFAAATSVRSSRIWQRVLFVTALVFMFVGLCPPPLGTGLNLLPLFGWTDGLWLITVLFTFYFAWFDGPMPRAMTEPVFRQQ